MPSLKRLANETAIYGVSSVLGRMLNYLLVPLYTATITPPDSYGVITELYAYAALLGVLFIFGMETTYFRFASQKNNKDVYEQATTVVFIVSVGLGTILFLGADALASFRSYKNQSLIIKGMVFIMFTDSLMTIPFAKLRLEGKSKKFAFVRIVNILTNIGLNLFFFLLCPFILQNTNLASLHGFIGAIYNPVNQIDHIILSNLIATLIVPILLIKEVRAFKFVIHWHSLQPMLLYCWPLIIMALAGAVNQVLSRALFSVLLPSGFYQDMSDMYALGAFGACYKLAVFMVIAIQAFRYAAEPFFFSNITNKNSPRLFAAAMEWFIGVGVIVYLGISVNLDWIAKLFIRSSEYRQALEIVPMLLLANLFTGIYYSLTVWFKISDKTSYGMWFAIIGAAVTIASNILLVPIYGFMGSAVSMFLCYFSMTLVSYFYGQIHFPIPYKWLKATLQILFASSALIILNFFENQTLQSIAGNLVVLVFAYIVFLPLLKKRQMLFNINRS